MSERNPYNPGDNDNEMQKRTLLAFVIMGVVLFALPYFFKAGAPPQPVKSAKTTPPTVPSAAASVPEAALPPSGSSSPSSATPVASLTAAHDEEQVVVDTDLYHVVFSNRGGVVKSWTLKKYPNAEGKPLEVVNNAAAPKIKNPFSIEFRDSTRRPLDLNEALFVRHPVAWRFGRHL